MADEHNIKTFTAADIEKYHKGLLSSKERHALEKAALDDVFLADALEGYSAVPINVNEDIDDLKKRLAGRLEKSRSVRIPVPFSLWKIAAMIILVAGAGFLVYQLGFNSKNNEIAQAAKKTPAATEQEILVNDSLATPGFDTSSKDIVIQQSDTAFDYKKTGSSSALASPNGRTANVTTESNAVKGDLAKELREPAVPPITIPSAKADDKASEVKRSLRNDNAVDKTTVADKNFIAREKEPSEKKLPDADGDGVPDRFEGNAVLKPAANNDRVNQGFAQFKATNVFRGRVTDANNNALPFSNITNVEDNVGTYSDARGYFNLTSPDSVLNVQVRSLGFESNNVQLRNTLPENKVLLEEDQSLSARILDTVKRNTNRMRNNTMVLEEPEPVDGWSNYDLYLVNNLKIPESFRSKQSFGGEVELSFDVDKNGEPVNITVKKSLCESCDKEAIRLIKEGPKWKRKIKKGKAKVTISF
jgi:CarboxypepD_reg-like domain/Gram-negative bacterial TonB protein C-terminal